MWKRLFGDEKKYDIDVENEEPFFRIYLERRKGIASLATFLQESERTFASECHSRKEAEEVLGYFSENWNCRIYNKRGITYYVFPEFIPEEVINWLKVPENRQKPHALSRLFGYSESEAEILAEHISKIEAESSRENLAVKMMELAENSKPIGILRLTNVTRDIGIPPSQVRGALDDLVKIGLAERYEEDGEPIYVLKDIAKKDKLNELRIMRLKAIRFLEREAKKYELMEEAYKDRLKIARRAEERIKELESEIRRLSRHIQSLEAERQALLEAGKNAEAIRVRDREIQLIRSKKNLEQEVMSQEDFLRQVRDYKIQLVEQKIKIDKISRLINDLELKLKMVESLPSIAESGESVEYFISKTRKYLEEEYKGIEELEREILGLEEEEIEEISVPEEVLEELKKVEKEVRVMRQRAPLLEEEREEEF